MKKITNTFSSFLVAILILSSCSTNKLTIAQRKSEIRESKENAASVFVKMKDGSIVQYKTLELVKGVLTSPHLLADGKIKIQASEIIAYQNETHYAVSQTTFTTGRKSFISKDALPGFAVRVVKGKLNIYCKKFYNGRAAIDEFFIQSNNDGKIFTYTPELMKKMIEDNQDALSYFNDTNQKIEFSQKIQTTAEMYNTGLLMSKN